MTKEKLELDDIEEPDDEHEEDAHEEEEKEEESDKDKESEDEKVEIEEAVEEKETDDERERIRARRKEEKQAKKLLRKEFAERRRREREILENEVREERARGNRLEKQIEELMNRFNSSDVTAIDRNLADAQYRFNTAEAAYAEAINAGNGALAAQKLRERDLAKDDYQRFYYQKQGVGQQQPSYQEQPRQQQQQNPKQIYQNDWLNKNNWYNGDLRDDDSRIAREIDLQLAGEIDAHTGMPKYDPNTARYWNEFSLRVARALPHRYGIEPRAKGTPPQMVGGRSETTSTKAKNVFVVPKELKNALIASGDWDNIEKRNKIIAEYRRTVARNKT